MPLQICDSNRIRFSTRVIHQCGIYLSQLSAGSTFPRVSRAILSNFGRTRPDWAPSRVTCSHREPDELDHGAADGYAAFPMLWRRSWNGLPLAAHVPTCGASLQVSPTLSIHSALYLPCKFLPAASYWHVPEIVRA